MPCRPFHCKRARPAASTPQHPAAVCRLVDASCLQPLHGCLQHPSCYVQVDSIAPIVGHLRHMPKSEKERRLNMMAEYRLRMTFQARASPGCPQELLSCVCLPADCAVPALLCRLRSSSLTHLQAGCASDVVASCLRSHHAASACQPCCQPCRCLVCSRCLPSCVRLLTSVAAPTTHSLR